MVLLAVPAPAHAAAPASWVVVDADTGAVLDEANARTPLPPASLTKVFTALAVVRALPPSSTVTVSTRAAGIPFGWMMRAGEQWPVDEALTALLLASANDAAMALAEQVSGSAEAFAPTLEATAVALGARDHPVLRDPAGLDGRYGVGGGNLVSAADLAIAARAVMAEPRLASVVGLRERALAGPDGAPRRLANHNKLLSSYPGAVGMKTGYTRRAGHCLIAVARREGRTLVAVVMGAPRVYETAAALLDRGFALPATPALDRVPPPTWPLAPLPAVEGRAHGPGVLPALAPPLPVARPGAPPLPASALRASLAVLVLAAVAVVGAWVARASRPQTPGLHRQALHEPQ